MRRVKIVFALLFACVATQAQPKYTIQDLGSLSGLPECAATAISQAGLVTGYCLTGGGLSSGSTSRAFLYAKGVINDFGVAPKFTAVPMSVNDSGLVAGGFVQPNGGFGWFNYLGPFLYQGGSFQPFSAAPPDLAPLGLTNAGQIAGARFSGKVLFYGQAVLMPSVSGQPTILQPLAGLNGAALGISPNGAWVAGVSSDSTGSTMKATLWNSGIPQALGPVTGSQQSDAMAVNDSGVAAGAVFSVNLVSNLNNGSAHATMFANGTVTDLGVLTGDLSSQAMGINSSGTVVGFSSALQPHPTLQIYALLWPPSQSYRAFAYSGGAMYDLNKLITNATGWQLSFAMGINNSGQIAGTGTYQGHSRAFLLTPVTVATPGVTAIVSSVSGPALAPGSLAMLQGHDLAAATIATCGTAAAWPQSCSDATVMVADSSHQSKAALQSVSPTSIVFEVPWDVQPGAATVQVVRGSGGQSASSTPLAFTLAAYAPALFTTNDAGRQIGMFTDSANRPIGSANPAQPGDTITLLAAGLGATNPQVPIGTAPSTVAPLVVQPALKVGGKDIQMVLAGLAAGQVGTYQVSFQLPANTPGGDRAVQLSAGGVSGNTVLLPVAGTQFRIDQTSLSFTYQIGGSPPAAQTVQLTTSDVPVNFTAASGASWLNVSPASATAPQGLSITAYPLGLGPGDYSATLVIAPSDGSNVAPASISVQLTVTGAAPGTLQLGPALTAAFSAGTPLAIAVAQRNVFVLTSSVEAFGLSNGLAAQPPLALPSGTTPVSLLAIDLNGDGAADFLVLDKAGAAVNTYLAGAAGYTAAQTFPANANPTAMTALNLNGDASADLAVIGDNGVALFTGNGDGTFSPGAVFDVPGRQGALLAVTAGSFTGAGTDDLVVSDAGGTIWLLPSDGHGGFGTPSGAPAGPNPVALAVGDFNGDHRLDVAVSNADAGTVSLLLGDGAGNLGPAANFVVGFGPASLAAADFDGDGKLDLAVAISGADTVCVLRGDGAGGFQSQLQYLVGSAPVALAAGDLDGDGKPDIAVAVRGSGSLAVLLNRN